MLAARDRANASEIPGSGAGGAVATAAAINQLNMSSR
jgi:hypothetical protein